MLHVTWYEAGKPDPNIPAPPWARVFGIANDGTVYAPAALTGDEGATLEKAAAEGIAAAMKNEHAFLPIPWLLRAYPYEFEVIRVCRIIDGFARELRPHRPS
ncbi:hypothetical protein M2650_13910 [Luteimonas sp. SX5]|uniref:Uncharacterized protein n=1 Tax=Luteimonas galliterrae TaxID=2940486 RepID=A0ABT0MLF8_9GAMM|nr:hypothetical protein [Luteimonas galliterrae]MCL1635720.1 hypothetical protein [Luteimonas galliterrae]